MIFDNYCKFYCKRNTAFRKTTQPLEVCTEYNQNHTNLFIPLVLCIFCWAVSVNYLNIQALAKQDREERSLKAKTFLIPDMKNYSHRKHIVLK